MLVSETTVQHRTASVNNIRPQAEGRRHGGNQAGTISIIGRANNSRTSFRRQRSMEIENRQSSTGIHPQGSQFCSEWLEIWRARREAARNNRTLCFLLGNYEALPSR
jgi:hypothetical protein